MIRAKEPAYPVPLGAEEGLAAGMNPNGLTKREHFAAMAMMGLLASGQHCACDSLVQEAWEAAELMLAYQEKTS